MLGEEFLWGMNREAESPGASKRRRTVNESSSWRTKTGQGQTGGISIVSRTPDEDRTSGNQGPEG
ncbi:MAG TPA: hypothetical protein PKO06_23745, partial [Candidatus Ozemobacteraceae bacterium]|nr:hypothetical protein [Candidatus Ozemobacteraceae bacterium]